MAVYTPVTITGYNTSPPPDDGSTGTNNQLTWAKHKDKLGDPIKTAVESINTNVSAAFSTNSKPVISMTHAIQTSSTYMRVDTAYATTGFSITHNKLSATSTLYVYLNTFITGTSNFEHASAWTTDLRLAKGAAPDSGVVGDLITGTTDDIQCVYFEDVGQGTGVTYDSSAGFSRIFRVIAANCPHGTTGDNEFQVWAKITADGDDGGTTFVNGTMYIMEMEE